MKVALLNDTRSSGHAGCILTMEAFEEQCSRVQLEIVGTVDWIDRDLSKHYKLFDKVDYLLINGEGSLHHSSRPELLEIAAEYPCALVNTVYQDNDIEESFDYLSKFKYLAARDWMSWQEMCTGDATPVVVPDIVFSSSQLSEGVYHREPTRSVGITDAQCHKRMGESIIESPIPYISWLRDHKCICTGRLHGAVICACLRIPFAAYNGNTHKIKSLMIDMGVGNLYRDSWEDAMSVLPNDCDPKIDEYVVKARKEIDVMFEDLAKGF